MVIIPPRYWARYKQSTVFSRYIPAKIRQVCYDRDNTRTRIYECREGLRPTRLRQTAKGVFFGMGGYGGNVTIRFTHATTAECENQMVFKKRLQAFGFRKSVWFFCFRLLLGKAFVILSFPAESAPLLHCWLYNFLF